MYMCVYIRLEKYIAAEYVYSQAECVCLYKWGDVEIAEKWNSLNDETHANFDMANVLSVSESSPMFCCWNHWHVTVLFSKVPETIQFIDALFFFFGNKRILDPIFSEFSAPCQPFINIGV